MNSDGGPISAAEQLIREFHVIAAEHDRGLPHQLKRMLELGCERLGMELGIVSRVKGNVYHVVQARTPDLSVVSGDEFELGTTYCSYTLAADGPVGFAYAGKSEVREHPCYKTFGLEAYLGIPLRTQAGVFGTLNFSSARPRAGDFDKVDVDAVQLMGTWINGELSRAQLADRVAGLERLLPTCSCCDLVRNELGDWQPIEQYFRERAGVDFSHGLCPQCEASGRWP